MTWVFISKQKQCYLVHLAYGLINNFNCSNLKEHFTWKSFIGTYPNTQTRQIPKYIHIIKAYCHEHQNIISTFLVTLRTSQHNFLIVILYPFISLFTWSIHLAIFNLITHTCFHIFGMYIQDEYQMLLRYVLTHPRANFHNLGWRHSELPKAYQ